MTSQVDNACPEASIKWHLKIGSLVNGPYNIDELKKLVTQGLLSPHSRISRGKSQEWQHAESDPLVHPFFNTKTSEEEKSTQKQHRVAPAKTVEAANFIIVMDLKREHNKDIEAALHNLGPAARMSPTTWALRFEGTAGSVRNNLVPHLGALDTLLVVDASRDQTAWFNFGPEVDAKIRQVWDKKLSA